MSLNTERRRCVFAFGPFRFLVCLKPNSRARSDAEKEHSSTWRENQYLNTFFLLCCHLKGRLSYWMKVRKLLIECLNCMVLLHKLSLYSWWYIKNIGCYFAEYLYQWQCPLLLLSDGRLARVGCSQTRGFGWSSTHSVVCQVLHAGLPPGCSILRPSCIRTDQKLKLLRQ